MSDIERLTSLPAQGSAAREVEVPLQHLSLESSEVVASDTAPYLSDGSDWGFMAGIKGRKTVKRGSRRGGSRSQRGDAVSECSSISSGHAEEKKFVCRGKLKDYNYWGCGRRFARIDALARHFRSEAGRVCIRPLYKEEKHHEKESHTYGSLLYPSGKHPPPFASEDPDENTSSQLTELPSGLLAKYPGLNSYPFKVSTRYDSDTDESGSSFSERGDILNESVHGDKENWADDYDGEDLPHFESFASQVDDPIARANLQSDRDQGLSFPSQPLFFDHRKPVMENMRDLAPSTYVSDNPIIQRFHVHWDLLGFMHTQFGDILPPVSSVVVLTGSRPHAYATTCGNYMKMTWPDTASHLLELLETIVRNTAQNHPHQKLLFYQSRKSALLFSQYAQIQTNMWA
jgi:hypothetical protein